MNEVSAQMAEAMAVKIIDVIQGYPGSADEKNAIAASVAETIIGGDFTDTES